MESQNTFTFYSSLFWVSFHTAMLAERKLIGTASAAVAAFMHNPLNKTKSNQKPMPFLCVKIKSLLPAVRMERERSADVLQQNSGWNCCCQRRWRSGSKKAAPNCPKTQRVTVTFVVSISAHSCCCSHQFFPSDLFIESSAQINKVTDSIMQSRPAAASA